MNMCIRAAVAMGAVAATLGPPAAAGAASVTITGDDGQPLALAAGTSPEIRYMTPRVVPSFSDSERKYSLSVTGPDGQDAGQGISCESTGEQQAHGPIDYLVNGMYTVTVTTVASDDNYSCTQDTTTQTFTFSINASTAVRPPAKTIMLRKPGGDLLAQRFRVDLNPGATAYNLQWDINPTFGADGGFDDLDGNYFESRTLDRGGAEDIELKSPGTFTFVAQAATGTGATAFSAPVKVLVLAPFDFDERPFFDNSTRGWPTFRLHGSVREPSAVGHEISISIAKGKGKFKPLTTVKVDRNRRFKFKFKQRKSGHYRLEYSYKGSSLIAPGTWVQNVTLGKNPGRSEPVYVRSGRA